jgi:hypothetical protein
MGRTLPNDANKPPLSAPISERCRTSANALPVVPLVVDWQEEETPKSLALGTDGYVRDHDTMVARVSGPCIDKSDGRVFLSVGADGTVVDEYHARVGVFQKQAALNVGGTSVRVQEILSLQGRPAIAVDAGGALYLVPSDRPPFSLPGGVTGEIRRGRRTALLLWYLAHEPKVDARPAPAAH